MREAVSDVSRLLYGRKRGRKLRPGQQALLERMLPLLRLELPAHLDPAYLFSPAKRGLWLEIGFGGGEHLAWQAETHPDIGFIGCEPFVNGLVSLFAQIRDRTLSNIRVFDDDARLLLAALPAASLGRVFILFPDPWPKKRYHKRRLVSPATLGLLAFAMQDGAELRFASDDASYLRWTLAHVLGHGGFEWLAEGPGDWRRRPADWPQTRYEEKAEKAGRRCSFLRFRRRPRGAEPGAAAP